jgi:Cu+-exporting ATPase
LSAVRYFASSHYDPASVEHSPKTPAIPGAPVQKKDPVCGMSVAADAPLRYEHEGETYVFCAPGCRQKFAADPAKYLRPQSGSPPGATKPERAGRVSREHCDLRRA